MAAGRRERFSVIIGAVEQTAAPIRAFNRRVESMVAPVRKLKNAFKSLAREAGFGKLGAAVGRVGAQLRRLGTYGAVAIGGLYLALSRTASKMDDLGKLTSRLEFPVEEFQAWKKLAELAGTSSEGFDKAMYGLAQRVGELRAGTGSLNTLLQKVDPTLARNIKSSKNTAEAFELVLDGLRRLPDATRRAALANAAFGRNGRAIINLSKQSADELAKARAQLRAEGGVISEKSIRNAEAFQDAMLLVKTSIYNVWAEIAGGLFPVVVDIANAIRAWTVKNRELIVSGAAEFAREFVEAGKSVISVLREWIPPIVQVIKRFGGAKLVLGAIAVGVLAPLVIAIGGVVTALGTIAGAVAAVVGPIAAAIGVSTAAFVAFAAAVAAVVTLVVGYWDEIKNAISSAIDAIGAKISSLVNLIPAPVRSLLRSIWEWEGLAGKVNLGTAPLQLSTPAGVAPTVAAPAAGGGGNTSASLNIKLSQEGRVKGLELEGGAGSIELDQGGVIGSEF